MLVPRPVRLKLLDRRRVDIVVDEDIVFSSRVASGDTPAKLNPAAFATDGGAVAADNPFWRAGAQLYLVSIREHPGDSPQGWITTLV